MKLPTINSIQVTDDGRSGYWLIVNDELVAWFRLARDAGATYDAVAKIMDHQQEQS